MANKNKSWFNIVNKIGATVGTAEIFIFAEIGIWDVSAADFANEFTKIEEPVIDLHIDSLGGSVHMGMAIHNLLLLSPKTINVFIDGMAASISSIIALAGDSITMPDNALFMIHNPATIAFGESSDMKKTAELLDKIQGQMAQIYANKTGKTVEEMKAAMDAETWYTGKEAKEIGFVDTLSASLKEAACYGEEIAKYKGNPKIESFLSISNKQGAPNSQKTKQSEEVKVDPITTVDGLKAAHPDLVKQVEDSAQATALAAGAKAERERITGIEALNVKGAEKIIAAAKLDPKATKATVAIQILEAQAAAGATAAEVLAEEGAEIAAAACEIDGSTAATTEGDAADMVAAEKEAEEIAKGVMA